MAMKDNDDAAYYFLRAKQEEAAARETANPLAMKIHLSLAERYRARALVQDCHRLRLVRD